MWAAYITSGQLMQLKIVLQWLKEAADYPSKPGGDNRVANDQDFLHDWMMKDEVSRAGYLRVKK